MAEKLKQYVEKIKEDFSDGEEELLLHRLYYLTGKQMLESSEELSDESSIVRMVEQSFSTIYKNEKAQAAETNDISHTEEQTAFEKAKAAMFKESSANENSLETSSDDTSKNLHETSQEDLEKSKETEVREDAVKKEISTQTAETTESSQAVRLALSVKKISSRYSINKQSFVFVSLPFHNQLFLSLASLHDDESNTTNKSVKERLTLKTAKLAYEQLQNYFIKHTQTLTPAQIIESGLFWFKKAGWGTFHFLVQESPYLVALDYDFEKEAEDQEHSFVCAFLQGVCSYAHGHANPQSFQVIKSTPQELQGKYGDLKNYSLLFYIKEISHE